MSLSYASQLVSFLEQSPSPFHAVKTSIKVLEKNKFTRIREQDKLENLSQGKYYFTRNESCLIGIEIPKNPKRFAIIGAHTDSPCLKVKPISKILKAGCLQVGVECYGGGLWHTWFDRDLSLAGRVVLLQNSKLIQKLVRITTPILRIPTLAIHLDRTVSDGFVFNKETHLTPVLGLETESTKLLNSSTGHHSVLLDLLSKELDCQADEIQDLELCLYDTHPPTIGGINSEFIHSARLDNLNMSFCSLMALLESGPSDAIKIISLFDNEEVGSKTAHGADSNLLELTLQRLSTHIGTFEESIAKSILISADMAHALHPNYTEKHETNHGVKINEGLVIKHNANQRYATTLLTTSILKDCGRRSGGKIQEFVVRNDSPCGSTIGPMLSAKLGLRTVDVGNPQWYWVVLDYRSMHSIRETCGTEDVGNSIMIFKTFLEGFNEVYVD